ncbi:hypothetical protein [Sorangium sp. So ce1182]|uniref:hypothetical protein n=1 Tax=Sorangium sp. So ce1182 TaxID=3133334 RepID=UPI003F63290E
MRIKLAGVLSLSCLAVLLFLSLPSGPLFAGSAPSACTGSYLIQEDGGAKDFWTFEADGSFFGTTSTQPL